MRFLVTSSVILEVLLQIWPFCQASNLQPNTKTNTVTNNSTFIFNDIDQCKDNEYYNFDIFGCAACATANSGNNLQSTTDKFSCECKSNSIEIALYDTSTYRPICVEHCDDIQSNVTSSGNQCTSQLRPTEITARHCRFKLINSTATTSGTIRTIRITAASNDSENCHECDLVYNFHYQDYCIANALLKPYLKYNSYWQSITTTNNGITHFGELKFVAFFCLALRNASACNQLANLCVQTHYSTDKHSPCSAFLLTQVADVAIKYASMDEHLLATRPFLYFRKGKLTTELLTKTVTPTAISSKRHNRLQLFGTVYAFDGTLQRWGVFRPRDLNLCQLHVANADLEASDTPPEMPFSNHTKSAKCQLTLSHLIGLAQTYADNNFISLFLNITNDNIISGRRTLLHTVPILIEDLVPENARLQPAEWQLVKRFQLISAQLRQHASSHNLKPQYRDEFKLSLYRSIRYTDRITIAYELHANNSITVPLLRLHYRNIELNVNSTLDTEYPFQLQITYKRIGTATEHRTIYETVLPLLLTCALLLSLLRTYAQRKRRATTAAPGVAAQASTSYATTELCGVSTCLCEFILLLISYASNVMLFCFLFYMIAYPLEFLSQRHAQITLPIMRTDAAALAMLIYTAFLLKFVFLSVHLWRISHLDLFFVDWERPRSYDHNHFTLKSSNPETSSVCSSVRTYASENNVSTWRVFFAVNEWIRLCGRQQHSTMLQGLLVLIVAQYFINQPFLYDDLALRSFVIILCSLAFYTAQRLVHAVLFKRLFGDPLKKFANLCSLANVSVFMLLEHSYGFYIHGRSPNGFADTDMFSMLIQLQRDSQNRCSRKGLLGDSDQQSYIILPPMNLRSYCEKLLAPLQRSYSISQAHFQKEINSIDATVERSSIATSGLNRFLCAFIDHAIKDMDYIIKEKTFLEKLFNCEFDNNLNENKGTFYIDNFQTFSILFLYGNDLNIFILELMVLLAIFVLTTNLIVATVAVCTLNKVLKCIFLKWVYQNITTKTSIDRRFLM